MTGMGIGRLTRFGVAIALVGAGCSNPAPRSNGLTVPSGVGGGNGTLSGSLKSYTSGAPVPNTTVRLGNSVTNSDATGKFTLAGTPTNGTAVVTATAPGFVLRGVSFLLSQTRSDLTMDLLPDAAPFSLAFYRELVRNAAFGTSLEPIRRWTVNPNFYFRQRTADTNEVVALDVIQSIEQNFTNAVPALSGGKFTVGTFEVGDAARDPVDGWVNVVFYKQNPIVCGTGALGCSTVGGPSATMSIRHDPALPSNANSNPYSCSTVTLAISDHEITHVMGYWHTSDTLTDTFSGNGCSGTTYPEKTRFHAGVAYSRPVGNLDPDIDTTDSAHLVMPGAGSRPTVVCDLRTFHR